MNWKEDYKKKVSKPAEAIKDIHDGQCVVMGACRCSAEIDTANPCRPLRGLQRRVDFSHDHPRR